LLLFALAAVPGGSRSGAAGEGKSPNLVIVVADNSGWGDCNHSGNQQVRTPNIDSIARSGASLDLFFSLRGLCTDARRVSHGPLSWDPPLYTNQHTIQPPAGESR
jgi:hypothetical protein